MRICSKCDETKSEAEFERRKDRKSGFKSACRACNNRVNAKWKENNPEKARAASRASAAKFYIDNPDRVKANGLRALRFRKYGISEIDMKVRLKLQEGRCLICQKEFSSESRMTVPSVDHDHTTGEVRGLLCGRCNTGLGSFKDSAESCIRAAAYLRRELC